MTKNHTPILDKLHQLLIEKKLTVSTAESCTGGRISSELTALAGSSSYFIGSIIAYQNKTRKVAES